MRMIDRTPLAKKYKGKWVAMKSDRKTVVGSGNSVQSALRSAEQKGYKKPLITRLPLSPKHFVGYNRKP